VIPIPPVAIPIPACDAPLWHVGPTAVTRFPFPTVFHACDQISATKFFTKKASCVGQSSRPTKTTHVVCTLDLINRCVRSLVNNVVLFLACQYEVHASWEAHLFVVAQTSPQSTQLPWALKLISGLPPPPAPARLHPRAPRPPQPHAPTPARAHVVELTTHNRLCDACDRSQASLDQWPAVVRRNLPLPR
jgi:hypothetical protein